MNVNYNNNGMSWYDMIDFMNRAKSYPYYLSSVPSNIPNTGVANANLRVKVISSARSFGTGMNLYKFTSYGTRLTANAGSRACFVRFPAYVGNDTGYTTYSYYVYCLLTTNTDNPINYVVPETIPAIERYQYDGGEYQDMDDETYFESYDIELYGDSWGYFNYTSRPINDLKTKLDLLKNSYGNFKIQSGYDGMGINAYGVPFSTGDGNTQVFSFDAFPFPVFEYDNTDGIKNYLTNGDDSGSVDPFDPNNPKIRTVTDFKTDFKTYVTRDGKNVTLKTIAYNSQYIAMGDERDDEYGIFCFKRSAGSDGQYGAWSFVEKATQVSYPTINIKPVFTTGTPYLELFYGFAKVGDDTHTYGFSIQLQHDTGKEYGFKINAVHCYGDFWHSSTFTGTLRTSITDGYQYTQSTDNKYMQVLFRAVTLDDLHDTADEGYNDKRDTEDTSTGTTATEVCGHGLGTYKVTQAGFDAINNALWSTDWTQLFKSNTIDPIKCVISCKGIPFAHSGTATDAVYIANQRIECNADKCNPVNTYNIGNCTIPAINNNFTDMTMTKVRVYLPYIAWVELPAEEVISRVGRAEVGIASVTKLLNFKYIVDFVDGSCRCVISVNGTERWFFDGNCGIDIPITSDNHTSAINNAIKSGVATVMNVGLAVGSAYAGNAMGVASGVTGAIGSLANTVPTYNYSSTANSSGYINHSMGNKIVIVIESPNIQMPNGYGHKYGFPCMRNLTLGSLSGYTKCESVDLTGINGTNYELNYIKSALESGVYL